VLNNGVLVFDRIDMAVFTNAISGSGTVQQTGAGTTTLTGAANYSGATTIAAGTLHFSGGVVHAIAGVSGSGTLAVDSGTALVCDGLNLPGGALSVGGTLALRSSGTAAYTKFATGHGADVLSGTSKVAAAGLTITGALDLKNNALIVEAADADSRAATLAQVAGMLNTTITSSTAVTNSKYTLALIDNSKLNAASIGGLSVDDNSVIVTEALKGDANMDGSVGAADLTVWKANFGKSGVYSVVSGDFNHDGSVGAADLTMWKANFGASISNTPAPSDGSLGGLGTLSAPAVTGGSASAVPEPASLAVLALGAVGVLRRRRRGR
jgi:autotransporter-associated beta strand protein